MLLEVVTNKVFPDRQPQQLRNIPVRQHWHFACSLVYAVCEHNDGHPWASLWPSNNDGHGVAVRKQDGSIVPLPITNAPWEKDSIVRYGHHRYVYNPLLFQ